MKCTEQWKTVTTVMVISFFTALFHNCASTPKPPKEKTVQSAKPLAEPVVVMHRPPLPNFHKLPPPSGVDGEAHGRGWDFNYDGHVDFVEVIENGRVVRRLFDFDYDGQVDMVLPK